MARGEAKAPLRAHRVGASPLKAAAVKPSRLYDSPDYTREATGPGKGYDEQEPWRTDFRRDFARFIHCASFRRLVGKTQLFSGHESDFFRNRLTHSLEVAQIAKSIAIRLNANESSLRLTGEINLDLVELAGLAHDLGHPPFGHNGEHALDICMRQFGGFEGNAQTLRILTRLEKKITGDPLAVGVKDDGEDLRFGLNLCSRTLASILKYDRSIPRRRKANQPLVKGYYESEAKLVAAIKSDVSPGSRGSFKTVECQIMDIADDIAYSTYDLEDAFKAGFLTPIQMLAAKDSALEEIAKSISVRAAAEGIEEFSDISASDVRGVLLDVFGAVVEDEELQGAIQANTAIDYSDIIEYALRRYRDSVRMAQVGYERTAITSTLVGQFISGVRFQPNMKAPPLSRVKLESKTWIRVEVLKRFCYTSLIMSPRLRVAEQRGRQIVAEIFERLADEDGHLLLPEDFRAWFLNLKTKPERMRVICDFIAGMTDRYAVEFHSRLTSETPQSMFKPI